VLTISPDRGTTLAVSCNRDDDQETWQALLAGLREIWIAG
jgi:hypothetical protein